MIYEDLWSFYYLPVYPRSHNLLTFTFYTLYFYISYTVLELYIGIIHWILCWNYTLELFTGILLDLISAFKEVFILNF